MRARRPLLAIFVLLGAGYIGYPYVTLYRLDTAVRHNDSETLRSLVDWYAVREGLKEDICDMVLDESPATTRSDDALPPFGASFVRGMTGSVLDQTVTPETLVSMSQRPQAKPHAEVHLDWAFFDTPTEFSLMVRTAESAEPIRVTMELHDLRWQVRKVSLPNEMLQRVSSGSDQTVSLFAGP
jgi:hypothetical protein